MGKFHLWFPIFLFLRTNFTVWLPMASSGMTLVLSAMVSRVSVSIFHDCMSRICESRSRSSILTK